MSSTFVIGGCRSGKSSHAQRIAEETASGNRVYVATCVPYDDEMKNRVDKHQDDRDETWRTVEEPIDIAAAVKSSGVTADVILVDCLTLWVTNLLMADKGEEEIVRLADEFAGVVKQSECPVVIVSNEVGAGIVPDNNLARRFRDIAGWVNQKIADSSDRVVWTVAGIPVDIKK